MIAPITDCACLVTRGMGRGAYDRVTAAGIRAIVTDLVDPDEAAIACASGRITNLIERLH
jgi:predicted Fe-Mo cluster-binding NifX family protein